MLVSSSKILACLSVIFPLSCTDIGSDEPGALIPLRIGNHWEYADSTFYDSDSVTVQRYKWSVVGRKSVFSGSDSIRVYVFRSTNANGIYDEYFLRNNPEGLTMYLPRPGDPPGWFTFQSLLLKFPLRRGESWETNLGEVSQRKTCLSIDTAIVTLVRTFHTYQVRTGPTTPWYDDQFYCYGIGRVAAYLRTDYGIHTTVQKTVLLSYFVQ